MYNFILRHFFLSANKTHLLQCKKKKFPKTGMVINKTYHGPLGLALALCHLHMTEM